MELGYHRGLGKINELMLLPLLENELVLFQLYRPQ
jgi:hypothetical protein